MIMIPGNGSLLHHVLKSTKRVTDNARFVNIDTKKLDEFASHVPSQLDLPPKWDTERQFSDGTPRTAQWVFVLDSINFSFWPDRDKEPWRIIWKGEMVSGYWALACSLKLAMTNGIPITDAAFLSNLNKQTLLEIFNGLGQVPMIDERTTILNEIGHILATKYHGSFANLLEEARESAARAISLVVRDFPSFNDISILDGEPVYFLKRAQILISDVWGSLQGQGLGRFEDLEELTAFADYRLPQLLNAAGILRYAASLEERIKNLVELTPGSREEVEIRAGTIQAVEKIRQVLKRMGRRVPSFALDWWLWEISHDERYQDLPFHRTRTIFY